ncbi:DUF4864 domain-containing protein [Halostella salina]|uniref:DUF4864 domain-containing protein n=1 Tax=Halostella salina TaxID=1547897 RepID=UPI000EF84805|nr:DUF4864 domain-containing protein [Halostella salina]
MPVAFDDALRDRSAAAVAAFVADLRAAGGWETTSDGATVTATQAGETRRLRVLGTGDTGPGDEDWPDAGSFDAVVVPAGDDAAELNDAVDPVDASVTVLDPADLYGRLAYGVSPADRAALLDRHFGVEAVAPPSGWTQSPDDALAAVDASPATASRRRGPAEPPGTGESTAETTALNEPGDRTADSSVPPPDPASAPPTDTGRATTTGTGGNRSLQDGGTGGDGPSRAVGVAIVTAVLLGAALGLAVIGPTPGSGGSADVPSAATIDAPTEAPGSEAATSLRRGQAAWTTEGTTETDQRRYVRMEPNCKRPPALVVRIQVGALRQNDPETNDGVRTLWRFASYASKRFNKGYSGFEDRMTAAEYRPLYRYDRVTFGPLERDGETASQQVTVAGPNGTATYEWGLVRRADDGCWLTDGVARVDNGTTGSGATIYGEGGVNADGVDGTTNATTTANASATATAADASSAADAAASEPPATATTRAGGTPRRRG